MSKEKVSVATDPSWNLHQWRLFIEEEIDQYGCRSILGTEIITTNYGGNHHVELVLEERR